MFPKALHTPNGKELDELRDRVEPLLVIWINNKRYHLHHLTYASVSEDTGISFDDLRLYFKYVIPSGIHTWVEKLRVQDSKELLILSNDANYVRLSYNLGFRNEAGFINAFTRIEGVGPFIWKKQQRERIILGKDPAHVDMTTSIKKVWPAWEDWLQLWNRGPQPRKNINKQLSVSESDFTVFCSIVLEGRLSSILDRLSVDAAKRMLEENPTLSVDLLSLHLGYISSYYFKNALKEVTGLSFDAWINEELPKVAEFQKTYERPKYDIEPIEAWKRSKSFCRPRLNQKDVAHELGFSENRFAQYLKDIENKTFASWIAHLRIKEAKILLNQYPLLGIKDVSKKIGLLGKDDFPSYLSEYTGLTIDKWLKNKE